MKKITILMCICLLVSFSFFCGCVNIPEELTQFTIISFEVEPSIINLGEYANLSWTVINASTVSIDHGVGNVALTGHRMIQPTQTTTYTLTASNSTITKNATVTITITTPMITIGDCADIIYVAKYASNNTIFNSSNEMPSNVFISLDKNAISPKAGYSSGLIEGAIEGLIGMKEGETKVIGPIPPEKAYGEKLTAGSIFTTNYVAFGMNQTVEVTKYTGDTLNLKWIDVETLDLFTMPKLIIKNLSNQNENEMVTYPPPYYLWENATSIISIADNSVTVRTTPTKSAGLSKVIKDVRYGDKQMMVFPNATTALWDDNVITITCEVVVGQNYTFQTQGYTGVINVTITINSIVGDIINITIINDQSNEPTFQNVYKTLSFSRNYVMPREYNNIPSMYISYFYANDIERAGYGLNNPLAGESIIFVVTVEKIYKTIK